MSCPRVHAELDAQAFNRQPKGWSRRERAEMLATGHVIEHDTIKSIDDRYRFLNALQGISDQSPSTPWGAVGFWEQIDRLAARLALDAIYGKASW